MTHRPAASGRISAWWRDASRSSTTISFVGVAADAQHAARSGRWMPVGGPIPAGVGTGAGGVAAGAPSARAPSTATVQVGPVPGSPRCTVTRPASSSASTRCPATKVPLRLPRSWSLHPAGPGRSSTWRRDTSGWSTTTSAAGSRPITTAASAANVRSPAGVVTRMSDDLAIPRPRALMPTAPYA